MWRARLALALGLAGACAGPAAAQVTLATDPDPAVDGTLRFEIENAGAGDVIDVQIGAADGLETIGLRTTLVFDQDLTLDNSSEDAALVDVTAPAGSAFLEIQGGVSLVLRDVGLVGDPATFADDIDLQGATSLLTIDAERAAQVLSVDLVGLGALRKEGSRSLQLGGDNTFSGGITVEDGDLIGEVRSLGTGAITLAPDESTETARLVFDFSGTDTLPGSGPSIIDGSSGGGEVGIVKRGSGLLDVSAASIGATLDFEIEAGTLRVGATQLSNGHDFDLGVDTTLELDAGAGTVSSASVLTGLGTVDVEADALTLTGDPSGFRGTFVVNAGPTVPPTGALVLDLATAPATGLVFDAVVDTTGAAFTLRDAVGVTWSGDLSGTGAFIKAGVGTTTLTGMHSHAGGTRVLAGTLVGNVSNLPGDVAVASGATLAFSQESDASYGGVLSDFGGGSGTVRKLGAGVLTLTDPNTGFTGSFEAERGGLHFAAGSGLESAGASLRVGNGAGGSVTSLSADFDPAGSPDNMITIGGALTFESDARLTVGIEPTADRSNVFSAGGAVTIAPGAVLAVETADGVYSASDSWDVLSGSSLSGAFTVEQSLFFFTLAQSVVSGNTLRLSLTPSGATLDAAATTPNGVVIGTQLDGFLGASFPTGSRGEQIQQAITSATADEVPTLLESVSPDDLAASTQIQLANANRTWRGISDRMALRRVGGIGRMRPRGEARRDRPSVNAGRGATTRPARPPTAGEGTWSAWIEGSGLFGTLSSNEAKEFDSLSAGPIVGADRALGDDVRLGFALSGGVHRYETKAGDGEGEGGGVEATLYGAWLGEPVEVIAGVRYAWAQLDTERTIRVGSTADRADGDLEGDVMGAFFELTRGFELPRQVVLAPLASVAWTGVRWQAFDEGGPSPLAVQVEEQEIDSILTSIGLRLSTERRMDEDLSLRPRLRALWNHEWGDVDRALTGRFASDPTTGLGPFTVEGAEVPRDHAEIAVGWEVGFTDNASLFFDWQGRFGEDLLENGVSAGGRVVW